MKDVAPFALDRTPLEPGVTLIEASAGTGKTFTLAGLILRFVLELRVPLREILAVTFTIAATEELRDRVRRRLRSALEALTNQGSGDEILTRLLANGLDPSQARSDLEIALQTFDEAQILTVHGFCQRVLRDHAFESGLLFDVELLTDPSALYLEVARDFWRARLYPAPPLISRLALARGLSAQKWHALLQRIRNHPDLSIVPGPGPESCAVLAPQLGSAFTALCSIWCTEEAEISRILREDKSLRREAKGYRQDRIDCWLADLELLRADDPGKLIPSAFAALAALAQSALEANWKAGKSAPLHPFFEACEVFARLIDRFFHQLTHEFLRSAATALAETKARRNILTYDDLLARLLGALTGPRSALLTPLLQRQYRAVLVDEFQDTDPVQYAIFQRLFGQGGHHLYLIGDPKQAIYAFRGADIFTYRQAAQLASRHFTLTTNYRSSGPLLQAFNTLFAHAEKPFGDTEINYRRLAHPERPEAEELSAQDAPLQLRWLPAEERDHNQADAEELIVQAVFADLLRLMESGVEIGTRPLRYADLAVLVRSNQQASDLQTFFRLRGIKSVLRTDKSVFASPQAGELLQFMKAVVEPRRDQFLRTALSTSLANLDAATIAALLENPEAHQAWLECFLALRGRWEAHGFITMFRDALVKLDVREKLVPLTGGERALTNFLHLAELLQAAEAAQRMAAEVLCDWLRDQIAESRTGSDETQLRLESDDDAVLIATIHKCKGLEYPVVFCPFLWKPSVGKKGPEMFFHGGGNDGLTFDLRSPKEAADHAARAAREKHEEALRVLYVALTRAKYRAYVYAGAIAGFDDSALAHVLDVPRLGRDPEWKKLVAASSETIAASIIDSALDSAAIAPRAPATTSQSLSARPFAARINRARMIASFTGLTSQQAPEEPDRDVETQPAEREESSEGARSPLADFERSTRAGLFFHDVLEHADFTATKRLLPLLSQKLASHGFPAQLWTAPIAAQLRALFSAALEPGLQLRQIGRVDRLAEVEFSFPVRHLSPQNLHSVLAPFAGSLNAERLQFDLVQGFMRGFIDLLFQHAGRYYLVDWKSNWLGTHLADYGPPQLERSMQQHSYALQYHLYVVAADLFLRQRLPGYRYETHFGGVYYIYLRGLDPGDATRGIFRARPPAELIAELRNLFTGAAS